MVLPNGDLLRHPKAIARHYLHTWFFVDFLGSFPVDWFARSVRNLCMSNAHFLSVC